jgi:hypothetical protein
MVKLIEAIVYDFRLTGVTPLLMHADSIDGCDELEAWRKEPRHKGVSKAGDDRSPPWTWIVHVCNDGTNIALPWDYLSKCCCVAGAKLIVKGRTTFKSATQSGIRWNDQFYDFLVAGKQVAMADIWKLREDDLTFAEQKKAVREMGFDLFVKRARVGQSKHIRVRAKFDKWEVRGKFCVSMPELTADVLQQILSIAGQNAGLGDWRPGAPSSPGPYGMFTAEVAKVK